MRITTQPIDVHVTGGPNGWDYVVGTCTIAATVLALIAIGFALKAGRDLVHDRRQVFELGILFELYERLNGGVRPPEPGLLMRVRLLPQAGLSVLHDWALDPKPPPRDERDGNGADLTARDQYHEAKRKEALREIEHAIAARTH
ncbi:MAG TPA: hypothetical protein VGL39_14275 [Jatrophihabitantaceae bacterium]